jgi:Ser-tRNA(Ala) deacylase AlaX
LTEPCSSLDGQRILYTLPDDHGLAPGQNVVVEIDWSRRYALMRLHFAAELVLEMICAALPGVERIGAHIAQDKARIAATGSNRRFVAAMSAPDVG